MPSVSFVDMRFHLGGFGSLSDIFNTQSRNKPYKSWRTAPNPSFSGIQEMGLGA